MKIGWLGLGRLGLPCALTLANSGKHEVYGYDPKLSSFEDVPRPYPEPGVDELLPAPDDLSYPRVEFRDGGSLTLCETPADVVRQADVIFVAVQTPHAPDYDGSKPAPHKRRDFDYTALTAACRSVCRAANLMRKPIVLSVISTVLPGTMNKRIRPLLGDYVKLAYNPFFIAMTTTIRDYLNPEFVLVGADDEETVDQLRKVYGAMHNRLIVPMGIPSAELTKVAYNTFISAKIAFANSLMEICHHTGADVDEVVDGLSMATDRLISPRYMRAGMGDGGACHPRDLIAMSWLAEHLDLSYNIFDSLARGREAQTAWLADLAIQQAEIFGLDQIVVLGKAYKPGTPLTNGSPALLLVNALYERSRGRQIVNYDPYVDTHWQMRFQFPAVYVIATAHDGFFAYDYPEGSVIIDPWRRMPEKPGCVLVPVGRNS